MTGAPKRFSEKAGAIPGIFRGSCDLGAPLTVGPYPLRPATPNTLGSVLQPVRVRKTRPARSTPQTRWQNLGISEGQFHEVQRALAPHEKVRQRVLVEFKRRGGSLTHPTQHPWSPLTDWRPHMADALTAVEDELELQTHGRMTQARLALRDIRRRIEWAVWP